MRCALAMIVLLIGLVLSAQDLPAGDMTAARGECGKTYKEAVGGTHTFRISDTSYAFGVWREGGWSETTVKKYLGQIQWASKNRQLSCFGIPAESLGRIFLFDRRPEDHLLEKFMRGEMYDELGPEYNQIAGQVRGYFIYREGERGEAAVGF